MVKMSIEKSGSVVVVDVAETTLGAGVAEEFRDRIRSELPDEDGQLVVGLTDVDALDTAALGALVSLLLAVRPAGRVVALRGWRGRGPELESVAPGHRVPV